MSPLLHHQNFGYVGYLVGPTPRACWFYKNIEKRQLWVRPMGGWNSSLQAAWYLRHAHWARLWFVPFVIWCLWIRSTIWMLILGSTSYMVGRSRVCIPHERYRSVTPLDATKVNRTILQGRTRYCPQPFCARILYNPHRGRGKVWVILLRVKKNNTKLSENCHPCNTRIGSGYISYEI